MVVVEFKMLMYIKSNDHLAILLHISFTRP